MYGIKIPQASTPAQWKSHNHTGTVPKRKIQLYYLPGTKKKNSTLGHCLLLLNINKLAFKIKRHG